MNVTEYEYYELCVNVTKYEYRKLYVNGSSPRIYGLPKVHKDGVAVRPILAAYKIPLL